MMNLKKNFELSVEQRLESMKWRDSHDVEESYRYVAVDGTVFTNRQDCVDYNRSLRD